MPFQVAVIGLPDDPVRDRVTDDLRSMANVVVRTIGPDNLPELGLDDLVQCDLVVYALSRNAGTQFNPLLKKIAASDTIQHFLLVLEDEASAAHPPGIVFGKRGYVLLEDFADKVRKLIRHGIRRAPGVEDASFSAPLNDEEREVLVTFDPSLSAEQVEASLTAIADYFRKCGGVGLAAEFEPQEAVTEEVHA